MYKSKIVEKLSEIKSIPTMFDIALRIEQKITQKSTTSEELSELIKLDPALTSKMIEIANSVTYASNRRIVSLPQIVSRIGFSETRKIAMSVSVMNSFEPHFVDYRKFWLHCISVAYISQELAERVSYPLTGSSVFSAGLLHDVGVMILDQYFPDVYVKAFDLSKTKKVDLHLIEDKALGINHADVGAMLLSTWGIPEEITEVIKFHHSPWKTLDIIPKVVYLANFIANNQSIDNGTGIFPHHFYDDIWERLDLNIDDVPDILKKVEEDIAKAKNIIEFGGK